MSINKTKVAGRFNQGMKTATNKGKVDTLITSVTKQDEKVNKLAHSNFMGGRSWDVKDAIIRLWVAAASSFFGEPKYYGGVSKVKIYPSIDRERNSKYLGVCISASSDNAAKSMENAIDAALDQDPKATLEIAARLRNESNIRTTPQVILVRAAFHKNVRGTQLISTYGPQIIRRVDDAVTGLAYLLQNYPSKNTFVSSKDGSVKKKKKARPIIPNSLKRIWGSFLSKQSEYSLAKYRMEAREVKTVDLVALTHPKGEAVDKLVKGELKNTGKTWEAIISEKGSVTSAWQEAFSVMGHMAMLRNIRNMLEKGVSPSQLSEALIQGAPNGKQIPFRYFSAYLAVKDKAPISIKTALDRCMSLSMGNLPRLAGVTVSLTDNSGSAQRAYISSMSSVNVATIGNLSGLIAALASDQGYVGVFGDKYKEISVTRDRSILTQLEEVNIIGSNIGMGTEHGAWLFWDDAIRRKRHLDNVFMYSD